MGWSGVGLSRTYAKSGSQHTPGLALLEVKITTPGKDPKGVPGGGSWVQRITMDGKI